MEKTALELANDIINDIKRCQNRRKYKMFDKIKAKVKELIAKNPEKVIIGVAIFGVLFVMVVLRAVGA